MKPKLASTLETRHALARSVGCTVVQADGRRCGKPGKRAYTHGAGMAHTACEACLVRLGAVAAAKEPTGQGGLL